MSRSHNYTRPTFAEASKAWKTLLKERGLPSELVWLFGENLCFEKDPSKPSGFRLAYQTQITPVPPAAEEIAYQYFIDFEAPVVFFRVGSSNGSSVCLLLCDPWFEKPRPAEGFICRDDWLIQFRPGGPETVEEVRDERRWEQRVVRGRPLQDLDFCMTLRGVHEILAHGRVLTSYEHYALRFLDSWRRFFGPQH